MEEDAGERLRFNILGPIECWRGGTRIRLGGPVQERILAALLLESGRVVPVPQLVDAAWPDDPPATATHQVRKAVADLRRRIPDGVGILTTDGPGYRVVVPSDGLDLTEFGAGIAEGVRAEQEGRPEDAVRALRAALNLWRGCPATSGALGEAASAALQERRLAACERLYELCLTLGQGPELVADLRDAVDRHPLRENLRAQLMTALYRADRQAEALGEYTEVRTLLVEELGVDPGARLTETYEAILRNDPALAGVRPAPPALASAPRPPAPEVPCTLPHDLADFTGRDTELRELLQKVGAAAPDTTGIVAVDGMGGCGKTTLAVHAAYRLRDAYGDGQLYVDLRGYTPGEEPMTAGAALDGLLRALGVPGARIPEDTASRTALWRASLAGKRLLVVLDNAADASVVRALLPTSPGCTALVTSRARLVDLDGAAWISLDVMVPEESTELVTEILGSDRVAAEPEAAAELARLCGHLPLALRIASARLRNRPRWTVSYLADRLRDETRRLGELTSGERSVAASLRLSYQAMEAEGRKAFQMLALHPGQDIDMHSAAALMGVGTAEAEDLLELLLDIHLAQQPDIGLYRFHDLVRSFAHSLRGSGDGHDDATVERLLGYYLTASETACTVAFPGRRHIDTGICASPAEPPDLSTPECAQRWFARERTTLQACVALADRRGLDRYAVALARNLAFCLDARGYLEEFLEMGRIAVRAARRLDDAALLGVSLSNLGIACWKLGRLVEGTEVAEEGRAIAARFGDRQTEAHSEGTLGMFKSMLGRFPEALSHLEKTISYERELGTPRAEAESLTVLSTLYEQWGRYADAEKAARRALEIGAHLEPYEGKFLALADLAMALMGQDAHEEAHRELERARHLCDDWKDPSAVSIVMALSADVLQRLGHTDEALVHAERALDLVGRSVFPLRRAKVENIVGRVHHRLGRFASAAQLHTRAHARAAAVGYRIEQAYGLAGLAGTARALGDTDAAARHAAAADELFLSMGVPPEGRRR
ncbi:MAG TPA: BTAD domain-containing putative transcriptional regulator [Streptomyces sp.]